MSRDDRISTYRPQCLRLKSLLWLILYKTFYYNLPLTLGTDGFTILWVYSSSFCFLPEERTFEFFWFLLVKFCSWCRKTQVKWVYLTILKKPIQLLVNKIPYSKTFKFSHTYASLSNITFKESCIKNNIEYLYCIIWKINISFNLLTNRKYTLTIHNYVHRKTTLICSPMFGKYTIKLKIKFQSIVHESFKIIITRLSF